MNEDAYVDDAAVYRLAAAVVKGMRADDPERDAWRRWGQALRERLNAMPQVRVVGALKPGHMNADFTDYERNANAPRRRRPRTK